MQIFASIFYYLMRIFLLPLSEFVMIFARVKSLTKIFALALLLHAVQNSSADVITYGFSSGELSAAENFGGAKGTGDGHINGENIWIAGYDQNYLGSFDSQLGTLNSVTFSLSTSVTISGTGTFAQQPIPIFPGTGFVSHGFSSQLLLKNWNGNTTIASWAGGGSNVSFSVISNAGPVSYSLNFAANVSAVFSDPTILAQFEHTGSITDPILDVENDIGDFWNTYFAEDTSEHVSVSLDYSFTYNFTPVPETSTVAILVMGTGTFFISRKLKRFL